jgi:hypothetical protein
MERRGYQVFHDLAIPGSAANVDHLVIGPTGVFVIDSKRYHGQLHYAAGHLWHGRRPLDRTLETLWWEATQVAETLGFGPDLHVYPVLCVHVARLPWHRELLVDRIPVLDAAALRPALQVTPPSTLARASRAGRCASSSRILAGCLGHRALCGPLLVIALPSGHHRLCFQELRRLGALLS